MTSRAQSSLCLSDTNDIAAKRLYDMAHTCTVLSSMMEWGLYIKLSEDERRRILLVCQSLRSAIDSLKTTLLLDLAQGQCRDMMNAAALVRYHSRLTNAKRLDVVMGYAHGATASDDCKAVISFMEVYAGGCGSRLQAIQRCHLGHVNAPKALQQAAFSCLLSQLPALEKLSIHREGGGDVHCTDTSVLSVLASCQSLHTLVLGNIMITPQHANAPALTMSAVSQLTQLRTLSLGSTMACIQLSPLSGLSHLECLAISGVTGPEEGARLPSIHTLRSALYTGATSETSFAKWQASKQAYIDGDALSAFPNLTYLEGIAVQTHTWLSMPLVPGIVKHFASSAQHWAWQVDVKDISPASLAHQIPPGSLAGLRNLIVSSRRGRTEGLACLDIKLAALLTAAPSLEVLCVRLGSYIQAKVMFLDLQPLQHAACMHTLWLDLPRVKAQVREEAMVVAESWLALSRTAPADTSRGGVLFPSLQRIGFTNRDGESWPAKPQFEVK